MFDVAKDRLSYGELLRPDVGYRLDFAVGMTYSLDLEALLGVPISLGLLEEGDEEQMRSPLYVLRPFGKARGKLLCFATPGASSCRSGSRASTLCWRRACFRSNGRIRAAFILNSGYLNIAAPRGTPT